MKKLIEYLAKRSAFVNLLTVGVIVAGLIAALNMKREAFPNIDFDIVTISVLYPGASPNEVEKHITIPLEREIKGVDGVKRSVSTSLESRSGVTITLDPDVKNKRKVVQDLKDATDRAKVDFPDDAEEPRFIEIGTSKSPMIEIALNFEDIDKVALEISYELKSNPMLYLKGKQKELNKKVINEFINKYTSIYKEKIEKKKLSSYEEKKAIKKSLKSINKAVAYATRPASKRNEFELRKVAKQIQDDLEMIKDIAAVARKGYRDREIHIQVDPIKMERYNVSSDEVILALANRNLNFPGGKIRSKGKEYTIRTVKEFDKVNEIYNVLVRSNDLGGTIRIKDIASIVDGFKEKTILEKANGKEAIILTALKKESGDVINLVAQVKKKLKKFEKNAPSNLKISLLNDVSFYVERRLSVLKNNVLVGLVFVIISLMFFLGPRVSVMVALGIPFSFAITIIIMGYLDISISLISMFGLIIVSGMIVDDAIVVGENVYKKIEEGMSPLKAAIAGTQEMVAPVFASVSTTMMAFMPLMFMSGIMGKFIWVLPAAVLIALAASLIECFLILPSHLFDVTKNADPKKILKKESGLETKFYQGMLKVYEPSLRWAVRNKYKTLGVIVFMFFVSIFLIKQTGFILFPKGAVEIIFAKVEAEKGINLEEMNHRLKYLEESIEELGDDLLDSYVTRIGIHQEQPNDPFTKRGKNYGQMNLYLTPANSRERQSGELISFLSKKLDPQKPVQYLDLVTNENTNIGYYQMSYDKTLSLYDFRKPQKLLKRYKIANEFLIGGGLTKSNKFLFLTGTNQLGIYNFKTKESKILKKIKMGRFDAITLFRVIPNSNNAIYITERGQVRIINAKSKEVDEFDDIKGVITSFNFINQGKYAVISTDQGSIEVYTMDHGKFKKYIFLNQVPKFEKVKGKFVFSNTENENMSRIENITFSQDYSRFYISSFDGTVHTFDLKSKKIINSFYTGESAVYFARPSNNNKNLWIVSKKGRLITFDLSKNKIINEKKIKGSITHFLSLAKKELLVGTFNGLYQLRGAYVSRVKVLRKGFANFEKIQFKQPSGGPPVGAPVQLELRGDDFKILKKIASVAKEKLAAIAGVYDIRDNWEKGNEEFHLVVNEKKASMAGLSILQIASTIQTAFDGKIATSIKKADEETDIRVIFPQVLRENLSSLKKVMVKNRIGNLVPITAFARFKKQDGISLISHSEYRRTVYVQANLSEAKTSSIKVNKLILKELEPIMKKYPNYAIKAGGEYEDTQESMRDLVKSFLFAFMGILAILVLLYGNFKQPAIIMSAIPLGFVGVSIAFYLHKVLFLPDLTFSFLASFGVIGLTGVVVNDSIILVDYINRLIKSGYSRFNAIISGGIGRVRAVILTTITTCFGVFPTAYGIGGADPFLMPMALAMGWGLFFGTLITLMVIPTFYAIGENISEVRKEIMQKNFLHNIFGSMPNGIGVLSSVVRVKLRILSFLLTRFPPYLAFRIYSFNKHNQSVLSPSIKNNIIAKENID